MKIPDWDIHKQRLAMKALNVNYGVSLANPNTAPKYGDTVLNPDRPLTGKPEHYLTGLEPSAKIIPDHICGICYHDKNEAGTCSRGFCPERKHYDPTTLEDIYGPSGVDIKAFRKECGEIDNVED